MQALLEDLCAPPVTAPCMTRDIPIRSSVNLGHGPLPEVTLATSILSAIAAAAAILLAPPPMPPLEQQAADQLLSLARLDGVGASALRTHIELGYPVTLPTAIHVRGGTSSRSPKRDVRSSWRTPCLPGGRVHPRPGCGGWTPSTCWT